MKRRSRAIALVGLLFCGAADATEPDGLAVPSPSPTPEQVATPLKTAPRSMTMVEDLFRLQDETARGIAGALADQKALLLEIGVQLLKEKPEEADALAFHAAAYVLSGGDPEVIGIFLSSEHIAKGKQALLRGAAAYMLGERETAQQIFGKIVLGSLPPFLAGRLAIARAVITDSNEPVQQEDLRFAIAAMPGTLVEESALRRSAASFAKLLNEEAFFQRLDRYARRFPKSIYAEAFWADIAGSFAAWNFSEPLPRLARLKAATARLDEAQQEKLYLLLARKAALSRQITLTENAAVELLQISKPGSAAYNQAILYRNLYLISTARNDEALRALETIEAGKLDTEEKFLLDAAARLGRSLYVPSSVTSETTFGRDTEAEPSPLQERAGTLLEQSSDLLEKLRS